jgi:hypothetical protein
LPVSSEIGWAPTDACTEWGILSMGLKRRRIYYRLLLNS